MTLPGGAFEQDTDRARARLGRKLRRARLVHVGCVVANLERFALEPVDPFPRLPLDAALGMDEVDLRGLPARVERVGSTVEGLSVALDCERVAGERQAMARDIGRWFRIALGGHDGPRALDVGRALTE